MNTKTTLVTAYYFVSSNTTQKADFMKRAERTMKIDQPMVIFCEEYCKEDILTMRKANGLEEKTKIYVVPYNELYFYKYRETIENNRREYWPTRDERAHTDVHIICISKFDFLRRALDLNPFNTPYMAWIDFSLLGKNPNNCDNYLKDDIYEKINHICLHPRPLFTVQVLNCWSPSDYQDLRKFYSRYAWIVAGGFFTTDVSTGKFIIQKLMEKVSEITEKGFGHGEEAFFSYIIDSYPEYFNLTVGDYQDMIHNYYSINSNHHYVTWVLNMYQERGLIDRLNKIKNGYLQ